MEISRHPSVREEEHEALVRLLRIGSTDTGQARVVADFLLAWWNAGDCGAYGLTSAWLVDNAIVKDMVIVFALASRIREYPDSLGYKEAFGMVVKSWRPELVS